MLHPIQPYTVLDRFTSQPKRSKSLDFDLSASEKVSTLKYGSFWNEIPDDWKKSTLSIYKFPNDMFALPRPPVDVHMLFETPEGWGVSVQFFMEIISFLPFGQDLFYLEGKSETIDKALTFENLIDCNKTSQKLNRVDMHLRSLHHNLPSNEWNYHFSQYFLLLKTIENEILEEDNFPEYDFAYYEREKMYDVWESQFNHIKDFLAEKVSRQVEEEENILYNNIYKKIDSEKRIF